MLLNHTQSGRSVSGFMVSPKKTVLTLIQEIVISLSLGAEELVVPVNGAGGGHAVSVENILGAKPCSRL